ncbi:hypothetical protein [Aureimonas sp. AU40]|uniref:hypothetical protein n=1 Tax=Aureimonas sp. AU40 TaxID=1637747 RepID=UPI000782E265|nr:hypothetical protein [Aureimonas sp. AU40]
MKGSAIHFGDGTIGVATEYYGRMRSTREILVDDAADPRTLARAYAQMFEAVDVARFVVWSGRATVPMLTLLRTLCGLCGVDLVHVGSKEFRRRFSADTWMTRDGWLKAAHDHQQFVFGRFTSDAEATATALLELACRDVLGKGLQGWERTP